MGEIADLMIEGEICEGCGCELDGEAPGFPRRCRGCGGNSRDFIPSGRTSARPQKPDNMPISAKLLRTLETAARTGRGLEYDGERWDSSPAQFAKLERRGYVERWHPHNPAHMPRAVITKAGKEALSAAKVRP